MDVSGTSSTGQRYAGHDVLEVSLEWTYGAITFLTGCSSKIRPWFMMRKEQGYNSLTPDARLSPTFRRS